MYILFKKIFSECVYIECLEILIHKPINNPNKLVIQHEENCDQTVSSGIVSEIPRERCTEASVKLTNGDNGVLSICHDNVWGAVCVNFLN
jgi:hypothetical protein